MKLIVLDRLTELKAKYPRVMQETVMELLRALSSPDMDIKKKVLQIAMDLVSQRSVDEFITYLKKRANENPRREREGLLFQNNKKLGQEKQKSIN